MSGLLGILSQELLASCLAQTRVKLLDMPDLEATLSVAVRTAQETWPQFAASPAAFLRHVARHLPVEAPCGALVELHVTDLYLAHACLSGEPAALSELDHRIQDGSLTVVIRQLGGRLSGIDVHGRLLERLLMPGPGRSPKLAEYAGRGPLDAWLKVVTYRVALNLVPSPPRETPLDERLISETGPVTGHAELDLLRERFRGDFRVAVQQAVSSLSARDRTVLRLSVIDGLSIDIIARTFGVHRATVARWIASAREQIISTTRSNLKEILHLTAPELDSLMGVADSRLEVSLGRLLRDDGE